MPRCPRPPEGISEGGICQAEQLRGRRASLLACTAVCFDLKIQSSSSSAVIKQECEAMTSLWEAVPGASTCWPFCLPALVVVIVANRLKKTRRRNCCRIFPLENPAKGACVVFWEISVSLCPSSAFQRKRSNSYFSWGNGQVTPYGGCHIMDHLGNLVYLVLPCFVVVVFFVFKQGFGTWIDKLARRHSQRVFCLSTFPTDFPCFRRPSPVTETFRLWGSTLKCRPKPCKLFLFQRSELMWAPAI